MEKVPYILVVGNKEEESGGVAVRKRKVGDQDTVSLDEFVDRIRGEINSKSIED